jgi:hypothetical protein
MKRLLAGVLTAVTLLLCATALAYSGEDIANVPGAPSKIRHTTHTTLMLPPLVPLRFYFRAKGKVNGADGGRIELRFTTAKQKPESRFLRLSRSGTFSAILRPLTKVGTYTVRAIYHGDARHLPSSARATLRVPSHS